MLNKRGPAYWVLYTSHIEHSEYTGDIKTIINRVEEKVHGLLAYNVVGISKILNRALL